MADIDFRLTPISTQRHAPAIHEILSDEDSCRYLFAPAVASLTETAELLDKWATADPDTNWAIENPTSGACLGRVQIFLDRDDIWEIGCMITPGARGNNLAERACQQAIDYTFKHKPARRIFADIDPDNIPSIRTFERLGFLREGYLRGQYVTHEGIRDAVIMGLMREDPRPWRP